MPFKNEHSVRVHDPSGYTKFRRGNLTSGVDAIYGIKDGKSEIQALRFDKTKFSPEEAKAWATKHGHGGSLHPAKSDHEEAGAPAGSSGITVPVAIRKDLSVQYAEIEDLDVDMLVDMIMDKEINLDELLKGIQHETEHTQDRLVATKIAFDHLQEFNDYYSKLELAEQTMNHSENERGPIKASSPVSSVPVNSVQFSSLRFTSAPVTSADPIIQQFATPVKHKEIEEELDDDDLDEEELGYDEEANELTVEAFSTGTHISAEGDESSYSDSDLDNMAKKYNDVSNTDPAPVCLGHPSDSSPAYGWVKSAQKVGGKLLLKLHELNRDFVDALRNHAYKKVSLSLYDTDEGPKIRHLAFLGAVPPAVKGLQPVQFVSSVKYKTFSEEFDMADKPIDVNELKRENHFFKKLFNLFKIDVKTFTEEKTMSDTKVEVKPEEKKPDEVKVVDHAETVVAPVVEAVVVPVVPPVTEPVVAPKPVDNFAEENATLKAQIATLTEQVATLTATHLAATKSANLQSDRQFCEELVKDGRLRPVDVEMVVLNLEARAKLDEIRNYSEEQSSAKKYREGLKAMPRVVEFGEFPTVPNMTTAAAMPAAEVSLQQYIEKKTKDKMALTPSISYWDAMKQSMAECATEKPEEYCQYMKGMIPSR